MIYFSTPRHDSPSFFELRYLDSRREDERERDRLAIAEGRMTAEEANAKWFAILKKEREDELRQMALEVSRG